MKDCLYCLKEIEDGHWCSMACKRLFLLDHYDPAATIRTMQEFLVERQGRKEGMIKEMKEKGLTASEYILGTKIDALQKDGE